MSKIAITGAATGTATFTIESPATSTNRTLTIPDATTTIVGTDATQTLTNKSMVATQLTGDVAAARITTALNATGSAPIFAARAWLLYDVQLATILGSGNVSSVTNPSTGDFDINFSTAIADANYSVGSCCKTRATTSDGREDIFIQTQTTGTLSIRSMSQATATQSLLNLIAISVFR